MTWTEIMKMSKEDIERKLMEVEDEEEEIEANA